MFSTIIPNDEKSIILYDCSAVESYNLILKVISGKKTGIYETSFKNLTTLAFWLAHPFSAIIKKIALPMHFPRMF